MYNKTRTFPYLSIIAACVAIHLKCLFFGITSSDDDVLIAENAAFLSDFGNILKVFTTDAFYQVKSIDLYRPLQSASFILDAQWGRDLVFNAHLTNLILHTLVCLTVFKLLRRLDFRENLACFGALLYAVHYLFMTAVAWLPARGDLLLALFALLTLATFMDVVATGRWQHYLLHGLFFVLAIFSKESAVVLPVVLALYLWAYRKKHLLGRHHLLLPLFYLFVLLAYFQLKSMSVVLYQGDIGVIALLKNLRTLPETVAKFYLPLNISTLPAYKPEATGAGMLLIAVIAGLHLLHKQKSGRRSFFYAGWVLLFITPGMFYYPAFYLFAFEHVDHRAYVTSFGLMLATLDLIQGFDLDRRRHFGTAGALVLVYLAVFNLYFSRSYKNPSEFAMRAIKTNPDSAVAYFIYGRELYKQGKDDQALDNLNKSVQIFSNWTPALHTRALIYRKRGQNREALADLDTIIGFDSVLGRELYLLRGQIKIDLQDYQGAIKDYEAAARLNPANTEAVNGLRELRRTISNNRLLPQVSKAQRYNQEGIAAGSRGDLKLAETLFRKALGADPAFYGVNLNLGNVLHEQGKQQEACAAWNVAAEHGSIDAADLQQAYCGR